MALAPGALARAASASKPHYGGHIPRLTGHLGVGEQRLTVGNDREVLEITDCRYNAAQASRSGGGGCTVIVGCCSPTVTMISDVKPPEKFESLAGLPHIWPRIPADWMLWDAVFRTSPRCAEPLNDANGSRSVGVRGASYILATAGPGPGLCQQR
jgi:hypothetical protein